MITFALMLYIAGREIGHYFGDSNSDKETRADSLSGLLILLSFFLGPIGVIRWLLHF